MKLTHTRPRGFTPFPSQSHPAVAPRLHTHSERTSKFRSWGALALKASEARPGQLPLRRAFCYRRVRLSAFAGKGSFGELLVGSAAASK